METIEKLGYDDVSKSDLFVLEIPTAADLPAVLPLTTPRFVCLIAWDARNASVDEISRFACGLLRQGAVYVCAWGPNCERVHDIVDEEHVGPNVSSDMSSVVMTTWHADESLAEAIRFALVDARPDGFYAEDCRSTLGIAIDSAIWAAEIRSAFSSPQQFVQRVATPGTIDFVAHDPSRDEALLVMVEDRGWGDAGALLPDLQAKLNLYLDYAATSQLTRAYPGLAGKPLHIELRSTEPPGQCELEFLRIVAKHHLGPRGIRLTYRVIGEPHETEVKS